MIKYTVVDGKYVCIRCQTQADTPILLDEHWRRSHPKKRSYLYKCNFCIEIEHINKMPFHLEDVHNIPAPRCGVCDRRFYSEYEKLAHQRKIHLKERTVLCKTCNMTFFDTQRLKRHQRVHSKEKMYKCDHCGRQFRWRGNLLAHLMIHNNDKRKKCSLCDAAFVQKASLNYHMMKHHPEAC